MRTNRRTQLPRTILATAAAACIALIGACSSGGGGGSSSSGGGGASAPTLRILATDAPFPYNLVTEAKVNVLELQIRDTAGTFTTLATYSPPLALDLVDLQNGATSLLYEGDPAPGTYDLVRIVVEPESITIDDNGNPVTFTNFRVPSGPQTGVKVFIDNAITVVTDLTTDLMLDFDLSRSFVAQGNMNSPAGIRGFNFTPVIRATNVSTAGSLTFRVLSNNATPAVTTDDFYINGAGYDVWDPDVATGVVIASGASGTDPMDPSKDGYVLHPAITAGSYEVEVGFTGHDPVVAPATMIAANLTDLGDIVLPATTGIIEGVVTTELTAMNGSVLSFAVDAADVDATPTSGPPSAGTDTTNTMGQYALSPLAFGDYDLTASKTGYTDATDTATAWVVGAPGPFSVDLVLVALTDDVSGTVTDAATPPNNVSGATVQATVTYGSGTVVIAETTTAVDGTYTFTGLPTGTYEFVATDGPVTGSVSHTQTGTGGTSPVTGVDITVQ
jgi:hypothetical protein